MSGKEKNFLEIVDLKKSFGEGETRQDVLRGMSFSDVQSHWKSECKRKY